MPKKNGLEIARFMPDGAKKVRLTSYLSEEVVQAAKNYVYATPGATLSETLERALRNFLAKEQQKFPGKVIPDAITKLKAGRKPSV